MDRTSTLLTRGVAELIVESEIRARLAQGRPLRLKQGFDPTRPDLHLGHAVGLRKLRAFQEAGHQVVLIVGDWTAQIGDPSGRDTSRPPLDAAVVRANAETYMEQFFLIVDRQRTEVRWQSEWYGSFDLARLMALAGRFTLAQMLAHETFRRRHERGDAVSMLELLYPMFQGYDSVMINADIEFGGTDQKFNILAGRELMAHLGMTPQDVLLTPLIPGIDGRKMSKSFHNAIDLRLPPFEMYSRIMALTDDTVALFFETLTDEPLDELRQAQSAITAGELHPMAWKQRLARTIVAERHTPEAATHAETDWIRQFSLRETPATMPEYQVATPLRIIDLLVTIGMAQSRSEARRLIAGGGVRIDGAPAVSGEQLLSLADPTIIQVGRRKFARIRRTEP